jgi:hypothetical protein
LSLIATPRARICGIENSVVTHLADMRKMLAYNAPLKCANDKNRSLQSNLINRIAYLNNYYHIFGKCFSSYYHQIIETCWAYKD